MKKRYPAPKGTLLTRFKLSKDQSASVLPAKPGEEIHTQSTPNSELASPNVPTRALSIRQPYVEQIMRGVKTIEYRSMLTHIRGRVYIYASLTPAPESEFRRMKAKPGDFPTGAILGTVEIVDCTGVSGDYEWHLANPERLPEPLKPDNHPQPSWFIPFKK